MFLPTIGHAPCFLLPNAHGCACIYADCPMLQQARSNRYVNMRVCVSNAKGLGVKSKGWVGVYKFRSKHADKPKNNKEGAATATSCNRCGMQHVLYINQLLTKHDANAKWSSEEIVRGVACSGFIGLKAWVLVYLCHSALACVASPLKLFKLFKNLINLQSRRVPGRRDTTNFVMSAPFQFVVKCLQINL